MRCAKNDFARIARLTLTVHVDLKLPVTRHYGHLHRLTYAWRSRRLHSALRFGLCRETCEHGSGPGQGLPRAPSDREVVEGRVPRAPSKNSWRWDRYRVPGCPLPAAGNRRRLTRVSG